MIDLPLKIKHQDEPRIALYYSDLHNDFVERAYVAILTEENKPILMTLDERIIDTTYVYLGEL